MLASHHWLAGRSPSLILERRLLRQMTPLSMLVAFHDTFYLTNGHGMTLTPRSSAWLCLSSFHDSLAMLDTLLAPRAEIAMEPVIRHSFLQWLACKVHTFEVCLNQIFQVQSSRESLESRQQSRQRDVGGRCGPSCFNDADFDSQTLSTLLLLDLRSQGCTFKDFSFCLRPLE